MKTRQHIRINWIRVLIVLFTIHYSLFTVSAKETYGYSDEKPLIIVSDWDFQPFEFLNNEGKPAGYNIEVLDLIFTRLDIPHKFVTQEWYIASEMFEKRQADLIHALYAYYHMEPYASTKKYINYYTLKVARLATTPPLNHISDLTASDTLILKRNDYAALRLNYIDSMPFTREYHTPKDALTGIRSGRYKYFIWGEIPLASKIKELNLDNIILDEIDIPAGELRIIGYNKKLVDIIDDEYTRLEQNGELEIINDKWFHPERVHDDTSPVSLIILLALALAIFAGFLINRLITLRVNAAVRKSTELNSMMKTALGMGEFSVLEYDIEGNLLRNLHGKILPTETMSPQEFIRRMPPEQGKYLHECNTRLIRGEQQKFDIKILFNRGTDEHPEWRNYYGNAIAEIEDGKTKYIVYTTKDITNELKEERENRELWNKYMKVFDTNIVAMSFHDSKGHLLDFNQEMRSLFGITDENASYFRSVNLFDVPPVKGDFTPESREPLHGCHHLVIPENNVDIYMEIRIKPVFDDNDHLIYYVITARDITAERDIYLELRKHNEEISKANEAINRYEDQLGYLLEQSEMFIWNFDTKMETINFTVNPHEKGYTETFEEFFAGVPDKERTISVNNLRELISMHQPINVIHHYNYTPMVASPVWYAISGIPIFDEKGGLVEYFGVARNITDLMEAQQKLKEESARAEDSGHLKAAFLANMTHEIRTPLNAIVGFSDILQMVETPAERIEFIRIIRNNCDMLLRLINDILEASSMGQALAIEPMPCDFAQVFDDICQTLEQRVAEAGIPFIKDNPYETFPAVLDKGRIQQVLTNFTTNAVKYTKTGHIKVGYREQDDGIYLYCEDTGAGIPKEKQDAVFERFVKLDDFVQGTGLGLSICKSIAEHCNGKIGVTSEGEGKGSTFWLWIPKEMPML